jgi:hypothetical protein
MLPEAPQSSVRLPEQTAQKFLRHTPHHQLQRIRPALEDRQFSFSPESKPILLTEKLPEYRLSQYTDTFQPYSFQ